MADHELQMQEVNICSDIEDLFDSYRLDNISDKDGIDKFLAKIWDIKQEYRRIYARLKWVDGENFQKEYSDYEQRLGLLNYHFKSANGKLRELKNTEKLKRDQLEQVRADLVAERLRKEIESLDSQTAEKRAQSKFHRKFFMDQVNWEANDYAWENFNDIDNILRMISTLESRLDRFQEIRSHYIGILGKEFETSGSDIEDEKLIASIREKLSGGKIWFDTIKGRKELQLRRELENGQREKEMAEQERSQTAEMKEKLKIENLLSCAETLHYEIKTRYDILTAKCTIKCTIDVDKLSEILNFKNERQY